MARKNIHIPSGGRVSVKYLESIADDLASMIKNSKHRLQED